MEEDIWSLKKDKNDNKNDIKAIFIEVTKEKDEKFAKELLKLCSTKNSEHLDDERIRFIPWPNTPKTQAFIKDTQIWWIDKTNIFKALNGPHRLSYQIWIRRHLTYHWQQGIL